MRIRASSRREVAEELADDLVAHAPQGIGHVFFVSGGSEAIEAALKLARQYFVERGEPQRRYLIARRQSYHGITLGALAIGGREWQRKQFAPLLIETHHVSPVYEYRERRADETPQAYGERLAQELEAKIDELGGDNVIAFVAETVVGATLGAVPAVPGYFQRVREICDRHGILLILDEVMCGMGRTGTLHACEQEGISPDLMAIAKGLGGGYAPIGAAADAGRRFSTPSPRARARSSTATPIWAIRSPAPRRLAVQRVIRRDKLLANVREQGAYLARRLNERFGNHPFVGDVRGRGLFQGVELVADRASKEPFDPKLQAARARQAGGDGARPDGLSDGRHGRRHARRSRAAGAALHRRCCRDGHHRRASRRGDRRGDGPNPMSRWSQNMRDQRWRRSVMKTAIGIIVTAGLLAGVSTPVRAQSLEGTLKKVKETGTITIGHRDSSIPLSYLDDKLQPIGFSIELCKHVVEAVKAKLAMPNLSVKYNPVTSATRLPLVANGTVDIECGSTANMTSRQAQVGFSYTFFVPQFKWITRTNTGIKSADDLRGKTVAVTAGTNTALFVNKMNNEGKLGMTIMQGKDHAESFLLVETGRASAWMEDDILIAGFRANAKSPADFKLLDQSYPSDPYALMIRKDDRQFKALVDETLAKLMRSGEFEKLYAQWFEKPIPPRAINIQLPMSDALKRAIKEPNDKPNS